MATRADNRGWGPGWPNCQKSAIKTLRRPDGVVLPVRREIALLVAGLVDETERRGYDCRPGWCWGFACRAIRGKSSPSNHSWGLAVDINAPTNPMTSRLVTDMPSWMPKLWKSFGFGWGGDYSSRPDAMHYEYLGTPASAVIHTRRLYEGLLPDNFEEEADLGITREELIDILRSPEFNFTKRLDGIDAQVKGLRRGLREIAEGVGIDSSVLEDEDLDITEPTVDQRSDPND